MLGEAHSWASLHIGDSMDILKFIVENQSILPDVTALLADHDKLIRELALWVSQGNAGKGEAREAILGIYAEEVQSKINWAYQTAKEVWEGKYGSGEARRAALGDDYDLVQYWVGKTKPYIYFPSGIKTMTDKGGKRYWIPAVPTARGTKTYYAHNQHKQGVSNIDKSGCGLCSALIPVTTFVDSSTMPETYFKTKLGKVTGGAVCPISMGAIKKIVEDAGISTTWVTGSMTTQKAHDTLLAHLRKGMPAVVALVHTDRSGTVKKAYTNANHFATLIGICEDEKTAFLLDTGGRLPRYVDLWDISQYIPGCKENPSYKPGWDGWGNCGGILLINL